MHSVGVASESEGRAKSPQRGLSKFQMPAFQAARSVRWPCTRTSRTCLLECKLDGPELSDVVTRLEGQAEVELGMTDIAHDFLAEWRCRHGNDAQG